MNLDKRCIFCNGTGVMKLVSGIYRCYCLKEETA